METSGGDTVTMAHFSMILAHSARLKRHEGTNVEFHTEINGEISSRISPGTTYNTRISTMISPDKILAAEFHQDFYHDFTSGSEASEKKHQLVKLMNGTVAETNSPIQ